MYELISVKDDEMTRTVKLKNLDTGTIEECFDDSTIVSADGFNFMKIGAKYECKIKLFGKVVEKANDKSVFCTILNRNIVVGSKHMIKIKVEGDEYYLSQKKLTSYMNNESFIFNYSRKDLIQVNNVIHGDMI